MMVIFELKQETSAESSEIGNDQHGAGNKIRYWFCFYLFLLTK